VIAAEAAEAGLLPVELLATTEKVYAVPLVRPVTVAGLAWTVTLPPAGVEVTVKPVTVAPLAAPGVNVTVA
jgi:hypothetical protein